MLDGAVACSTPTRALSPRRKPFWRQGDKYKVPRIVFANKMDKNGADFFKCLEDIKTRLGARPIAIQLPIGAENNFQGLVDLVRMKAVIWTGEALGADFDANAEIPADLVEQAKEYRMAMIEAAVEMDDAAMEAYLEGNEPDEATLKNCIPQGRAHQRVLPVLCGSAFKNKGVQPLLDAVVDYLLRPSIAARSVASTTRTGEETDRKPGDDQPLALLAFKIMDDPMAC